MSMVAGIRALLLLPACMYGFRIPRSGAATNEARSSCGFKTEPVSKMLHGGYRSFIYTERYDARFFRNGVLRNDRAFGQYTQWLQTTMARNFADVNPFNQTALLIRQRGLFEDLGRDTSSWDVILNGRVGGISASNCIESLLWAEQNKYHPLSDKETEAGAYILLDRKNTTVKVYLQTGPGVGVPALDWAFSSMEQDLNRGFKLLAFIHNHPFFANSRYDCGGTCLPSGPDLNMFPTGINRHAQEFWITNGFDSFRFRRSELDRFPTSKRGLGMASMEERPEGPLDSLLELNSELGVDTKPI